MNNEHRHDLNQVADEEALMDDEEVAQAKLNQRKADYIRYLLTDFIKPTSLVGELSVFQYEVWQDWKDDEADNVMEVVRLNLACGDDEAAGMALVASLRKAMDEIAAQAVRENMKHG